MSLVSFKDYGDYSNQIFKITEDDFMTYYADINNFSPSPKFILEINLHNADNNFVLPSDICGRFLYGVIIRNFSGDLLNIANFPYLESIFIVTNGNKIEIINCPNLRVLTCMSSDKKIITALTVNNCEKLSFILFNAKFSPLNFYGRTNIKYIDQFVDKDKCYTYKIDRENFMDSLLYFNESHNDIFDSRTSVGFTISNNYEIKSIKTYSHLIRLLNINLLDIREDYNIDNFPELTMLNIHIFENLSRENVTFNITECDNLKNIYIRYIFKPSIDYVFDFTSLANLEYVIVDFDYDFELCFDRIQTDTIIETLFPLLKSTPYIVDIKNYLLSIIHVKSSVKVVLMK